MTRAVLAGAVLVTGGFTALVARTLPGKSGGQRVSTTGDQPAATPSPDVPQPDGSQPDDPGAPPSTSRPPTTVPSFGNVRPLLPPSRPPRSGSGSGRAVSGSS